MSSDAKASTAGASARWVAAVAMLSAPALVLPALGLVACGEDSGSTAARNGSPAPGQQSRRNFGSQAGAAQARRAQAVLVDYLKARGRGEWSTACTYVARPVLRLYARFGSQAGVGGRAACARAVKRAAEDRSSVAHVTKADVGPVRVDGDRGYVFYEGPKSEYAMPIVREDGDWKLGSGVGTPLGEPAE